MKIRIAILITALAALSLSCKKETPDSESPVEGVTSITATLSNDGWKTVLGENGTSVLWSPGDEISVFYNEDGVRFTSINTKPKATTVFTSEQPIIYGGTDGTDGTMLYGVYPYAPTNAQQGEELILSVPSGQTAEAGTFANGSFPSVGRSEDTNIAFYNVCGGVRFSVFQSDIWIVRIKSASGEPLAGKVKVGFDASGHPELSQVIDGEDTVTLMLPDGEKFEKGKWYFISLLPVTLSNGFTMDFIKNEDDIIKRTFTSSVTIKRTTFGTLKNADSDATSGIIISNLTEVQEEWSL